MTSYLLFQLTFRTEYNQHIRITGNAKELGEWDPKEGIVLTTSENKYPTWYNQSAVDVQIGTILEFKCVVMNGDTVVRWEDLPNNQNRKYRAQYFKTVLIMKENNSHVLERPIIRYISNLDTDVMDLTHIRKIDNSGLDPLKKAESLSSSSGDDSMDMLNKLSLTLPSNEDIKDQISQQQILPPQPIQQLKPPAEDSKEQLDLNSLRQKSSSLYQVPKHLELFYTLLNKVKKDSQVDKTTYPSHRKLNHMKQQDREQTYQPNSTFMIYNNQRLDEFIGDAVFIIVSWNLPINLSNAVSSFSSSEDIDNNAASPCYQNCKSHSNCSSKSNSPGLASPGKQLNQQIKQLQQQHSASPDKARKAQTHLTSLQDCLNDMQMNMQMQHFQSTDLSYTSSAPALQHPKQSSPVLNSAIYKSLSQQQYQYQQQQLQQSQQQLQQQQQLPKYKDKITFQTNYNPFTYSFYEHLKQNKINFIWLGCTTIPEAFHSEFGCNYEEETKELKDFMLQNFKIWPIFLEQQEIIKIKGGFLRRLHPSGFPPLNQHTVYEEDEGWASYKQLNHMIARQLKYLVDTSKRVFSILFHDYHFFLAPSYFRNLVKQGVGHFFGAGGNSNSIIGACSPPLNPSTRIQRQKHKIAYLMTKPFLKPEQFQLLPASQKILHSILFSDFLMFSTYDQAQSLIDICNLNQICQEHMKDGKVIFPYNGRDIQLIIDYPGLNVSLYKTQKHQILTEHKRRQAQLQQLNKHIIVGVDILSKYSGLEYKFFGFAQFISKQMQLLNKKTNNIAPNSFKKDSQQQQQQGSDEYKLIQIVYLGNNNFCVSNECEFVSVQESKQYLKELINFTKKIANMHGIQESCIEIIDRDTIDFNEYLLTLSLSEVFIQTNLLENSTLHYLEYLLMNPHGQVIQTSCLQYLQYINSLHIINPLNFKEIQEALKSVFQLIQDCKPLPLKQSLFSQQQQQLQQQQSPLQQQLQQQQFQQHLQYLTALQSDISARVTFDQHYVARHCAIESWFQRMVYNIQKKEIYSDTYHYIICDQTVEREEVFILHERQGSMKELPIGLISTNYQNCNNCLIILSFRDVFFHREIKNEGKINTDLVQQIEILSKNPKNTIYIISDSSPESLDQTFGHMKDIVLLADGGIKIKKLGIDKTFQNTTKLSKQFIWKPAVMTHIEQFVAKTSGSYIIESECEVTWKFEKVNKQFADIQRKELINLLLQIVENMPGLEVFECQSQITVRPSFVNTTILSNIIIESTHLEKKCPIDLFICIGGRKQHDEELLLAVHHTLKTYPHYFDDSTCVLLGAVLPSTDLPNIFLFHDSSEVCKLFNKLTGENKNEIDSPMLDVKLNLNPFSRPLLGSTRMRVLPTIKESSQQFLARKQLRRINNFQLEYTTSDN